MPIAKRKSTEGMVDYNENSSAQLQIVRRQATLLQILVDRVEPDGSDMRIVDYGCGPGLSTIEAVRPSIEAYRAKSPEGPIVVCHADQPGNDWNTLFRLIESPSGYLVGQKAVRTEAAVGSFYDQMATEDSVSIGTCFAASHWLSEAISLDAPGTVWFADLVGDARVNMWDQAVGDWTRFLSHRARELKSGGFFLVSTLGSVPDPDEINGTAASGRGVYRALQSIAQEMVDDGLIDPEVLNKFVFGLWFLTAAEAREPLETDPFLKEAFEIEEINVVEATGNAGDFFAALIDDPVKYAEAYTGYIRAYADSTLHKQLFEPSAKDSVTVEKLAEEYYRRLNALYLQHPAKYAFELWTLTVILRKR
ncbi:MAG: class I SAM-dependent methyltransferase [Proteobacteria bacterium]|nr:class I SAM-dependent methyltransferase [Pseudomonadota bacterium]